jgi:hypothetical protein
VLRYVKPLVPAAFAVVRTHQSALGPRGGYGPFSSCVHKEGQCPSSGDINRLMMMMALVYGELMKVKNELELSVLELLKTMLTVLERPLI